MKPLTKDHLSFKTVTTEKNGTGEGGVRERWWWKGERSVLSVPTLAASSLIGLIDRIGVGVGSGVEGAHTVSTYIGS